MIIIKLELIPKEGVVKPYIDPYGYIFRAIFMSWLKQLEPKLVHELHSNGKIRPYSIQVSARNEKLVFYLNLFNIQLANPIMNDLLNHKEKSFQVSDQTFLLKKALFEDISLNRILSRAKPVKSFRVEFLEPTYFRTTRSNNLVRLPIPELIFSNLTNLWNKLYEGNVKIEKESFLDWVNSNIYPSSLEIKTKAKEMGEFVPAVGFIGWVNFKIDNNNSNYAKFIDLLCSFGELSNLGGNRTAGFGVIKYIPTAYFNKTLDK